MSCIEEYGRGGWGGWGDGEPDCEIKRAVERNAGEKKIHELFGDRGT